MRKDKEEVLRLRRSGKSYNEIRGIVRIPKSTLSEWLHGVRWSEKIKKHLDQKAREKHVIRLRQLDAIRGRHLARIYREALREAREEFSQFKFHPLFISGISLYWGEGDRASRYGVRIANTDPLMIRLFVRFLRSICGVPKERIRAYLLLYPDLDERACRNFWATKTGLRSEAFNKSVVINGRHKTRRLQYGVCTVGISSTYLKEKLKAWLTLLPNELEKREYYAGVV